MCYRSCCLVLILYLGSIAYCNTVSAQEQETVHILTTEKTIPDSINWLSPDFNKDLDTLYTLTRNAGSYGLFAGDYALPVIVHPVKDSICINREIHAIAANFFSALAYGTSKPSFSYEGITNPVCNNSYPILLRYARAHHLTVLTDSLNRPFTPLLKKVNHFQQVMNTAGFSEIRVKSNMADPGNKSLVEKLYQLGFLKETGTLSAVELKKAILLAQKGFDLLTDGKIRSTLLEQLNITLSTRLLQCRQALNDLRWFRCQADREETILVNIPAAYMQVYKSGTLVLDMKMVVGKQSTPTPVFTSRIQQVIVYPYWHVPHSIATKELLPLIKLSPAFIDKGGYQVLNSQGKIMDPYRINWKALSPAYFPYLMRQSTGCDNALGLLKLEFYTPFGVYLHDTPSKNSFNLHKRYFSHGCMRMEKPMELGRMILRENTIAIDTITAKGCLTNQSPIPVTALHKMALVVWYNPAAIDSSGELVFYEDVYKKFKQP